MDTNNCRPTPASGEPTMDTGDWRTQLQHDSRQRIVNKIMDTLRRHLPFSGQEALNELRKISVRFEEKIFMAASSQSDYLRRISLKMLTMETKYQNTIPDTGSNTNPPVPGSQSMQNLVHSQGQSIPLPLQGNQSQARQQLSPQSVPINLASTGVPSSTGLQSGMPSVSGLTQNPIPNIVGRNSNMQNISGISQSSPGQGVPSNIFDNQQKQMPVRQQALLQLQQHLYHVQLQQQLMKQKILQGNLQPSLMLSHMQENILPPTQLQSSQQPASLDSTAQIGHANGGDWQEEVYQKIKAMKETYLPELNEMRQKIAAKLLQHDSLPQQPKFEQLEKLKIFEIMLERIVNFLSISKSAILPTLKDKLSSYEKQIINIININRPGKPISVLQQGQLPPTNMRPMEQPQPQIYQTQSHDNQMNPQLPSINLQGSMPIMQPNDMKSLQHNSFSSLPGVSTVQQAVLNSLQPGSNLDPGQGNALGSMQQVAPGPLQQNSVSTAQQANISSLSLKSGLSVLQQNLNPLQLNSNMLHHQHMKQQQEQQILQLQQHLILLQYMQRHKLLQQQQQQLSQLQAHQMTQLHQMNENDMRQGMGVKAGVFQHLPAGQSQSDNHQQLKLGAPFPVSSP